MSARATLVNRLDLKKRSKRHQRRNSKHDGALNVDSLGRRSSVKRRGSRRPSKGDMEPVVAGGVDVMPEKTTDRSPERIAKGATIESPFQRAIVDHAKTTAMLEEELRQKKAIAQKLLQARRRAKMEAVDSDSGGASDEADYEQTSAVPSVESTAPVDVTGEHERGDTVVEKRTELEELAATQTVPSLADQVVNEASGSEPAVAFDSQGTKVESVDLRETLSVVEKIDALLGSSTEHGSEAVGIDSEAGFAKKLDGLSKISERFDSAVGEDDEDDGSFRSGFFQRVVSNSPGYEKEDAHSLSGPSMHSYNNYDESGLGSNSKHELVEWGVWSSESEGDIVADGDVGGGGSSFSGVDVSPAVPKPSFVDWGTVDEVVEDVDEVAIANRLDSYSKDMMWGEFSSDSELDIEDA